MLTFLSTGPATPKSYNLLPNPIICIEAIGHFTQYNYFYRPNIKCPGHGQVLGSIPVFLTYIPLSLKIINLLVGCVDKLR